MVRNSLDVADRLVLDPKNPLMIGRLFLCAHRLKGEDAFRFWTCDFWRWEQWEYRRVEMEEIRRLLYRWLEECMVMVEVDGEKKEVPFFPTKARVDAVLDAIRAESFLKSSIPMPAWLDGRTDDPRECLPTRNGIVNLPKYISGESYLEPPTPLYFCSGALPFEFSDTANSNSCPLWLEFLDQVFDGDVDAIACLQEWFGYNLTCDTRQQKAMMLIGPKRSGKGTIGRTLASLIGVGNVASPTLCSLTTNFGLWPLIGKSLAIVGDARLSGRTDQAIITERILSITGEDLITIDRKHHEPVTARLFCRLMLLSNELPRLTDASGALASRFLILTLRQSFFGREDTTLEARLRAELPAILHWAIEGWSRLRETGRFTVPKSSAEAVEEMDELGSPITAFVRETCTVKPDQRVYIDDLYRAWLVWCEQEGRDHPGTKSMFGRDLSAALPGVKVTQPRVNGSRLRMYEGIGIGVCT
jgi:putative DNA primase/helicase